MALDLSDRELQIARLVGEDLSTKEIAAYLEISPASVRVSLGMIYLKLGIHARWQLERMYEYSTHIPDDVPLTKKDWNIIRLVCIDGYGIQEIADELATTYGAIESRLHRIYTRIDHPEVHSMFDLCWWYNEFIKDSA